MEEKDKPLGKIYNFLKPLAPGEPDPFDKVEPKGSSAAIVPFTLPEPGTVPPRGWMYGQHYIRGYVSATMAGGGVGKSSLVIVEMLAMASGHALLGVKPRRRLKTWLWNGEDPLEELQRRLAAACLHHGITQADIDGYLYVDSGRDSPWSIASQTRDGLTINDALVEDMIVKIRRERIDVVIIDPFVASHQVPENDNNAIAAVAAKWGEVAERGQCSVMLVHHARKTPLGSELTMEDMRGASALLTAVRAGRALNQMPSGFADKYGIENHRSFIRINNTTEKNNLSPARLGDDWYRLVSVCLHNGIAEPGDGGDPIPPDHVGVVTGWIPPNPLAGIDAAAAARAQALIGEGEFRLDQRAWNWIGIPVAEALGLDVGLDAEGRQLPLRDIGRFAAAARQKVKDATMEWIRERWLEVIEETDDKRMVRKFVVVGDPVARKPPEVPGEDDE